jgi:Flp pilus assembly protein TadD
MKRPGVSKIAAATVALMVLVPSCGKKRYESNAALLGKAVESAAPRGEWDKAEKLVEQAVAQNPNDANARTMLALALEQRGDLEKALSEAEAAIEADADNFMAQYTYGRLLFKSKDYGNCPKPLKKANALKPKDPHTLLLLAKTYAMLDIDADAITYYAALAKTKQYAGKPEPYNELGVLFLKKKNYQMAKKLFQKALEQAPDNPVVNKNMGVFWESIASIFEKTDAKKARIASAKAVQHYKTCLSALSASNPASADKRRAIQAHIDALSK